MRVEIEPVETESCGFADLGKFAADLPDAPPDVASQHNHYLYGLSFSPLLLESAANVLLTHEGHHDSGFA